MELYQLMENTPSRVLLLRVGEQLHIPGKEVSNQWTYVSNNKSYTTSTCDMYRCVVSNEAGSVKSNEVEVKFEGEYA